MTNNRDLTKITGSLASQFAESETLRLARMSMGSDSFGRMFPPSSTSDLLQRAMADARIGSFGSTIMDDSVQRALRLTDPYQGYGSTSEALQREIDRSLSLEKYGLGIGVARGVSSVSEEVYRELFGGFGGTIGDVLRNLEEQPGLRDMASTQRKVLERETALFGAFSRATHWSDALTGLKSSDYGKLLGDDKAVHDQMDVVTKVAGALSAAQDTLLGSRLQRDFDSVLGMTVTKLSLFAGSIDVLGPASVGSHAAFDALMGGYSAATVPDNRGYWSQPAERALYYRDHDVDEGLIEAEAAATITALIETGIADGDVTRRGTTKLVMAGNVKMEIIASRPKATAYAAIDAFEVELRHFIESRLEPAAGEKWFVQRVPGDIVKKAKTKRLEAIRSGEVSMPLIHYLDLGELLHIIVASHNWAIFGPIFDRAEWLRTYLERLNALRRPVSHSRPFDAVQLVEVVMTIRTLTTWMQRDADWQSGWDDDV